MLAVSGYVAGLRLNLSPSLPRGVYRLTAVPQTFTHQHLVTLPVPRSVHPFVARWVPLLKPVAGLPGDIVCHTAGRFVINEEDYGPIYRRAHGHPLPTLEAGCHVIPANHLALASHAPKSVDSRYFGLVAFPTVTAGATPVWTWE